MRGWRSLRRDSVTDDVLALVWWAAAGAISRYLRRGGSPSELTAAAVSKRPELDLDRQTVDPARVRRQLLPIPRWPRRLLIAVNVLTAVSLASAGTVYGYVRYRESQLRTQAAPHLVVPIASASAGSPKGSDGLPAMNILLIGNNTRTGLSPAEAAQFGSATDVGGARSDVTMILHLDPITDSASLLSIPRDLFVSLPTNSIAGPYGKIDAALNGTVGDPADGPDTLIQTIEDDLGIPINHFISINFDGFQQTINAIGGIQLNFSALLRDQESALNITGTGCQTLNGSQALAVVRARHLQYFDGTRWQNDPESDLSRIVRDHIFLKVFADTARVQLTDPLSANSLIGGLLNQVTVDPGLNVNTLLQLYKQYRHLNPDAVAETTLPITVVDNYRYGAGTYGDVDMPVEPLDHQVIDAWAGGPLTTTPTSALRVQVDNISGIYGQASAIGDRLVGLGYQVTDGPTLSEPTSITETVIRYHPGATADGLDVLRALAGAVMMRADPTVPASTVIVDVGSVVTVAAFSEVPDTPAASIGAAPATTPTTATTPMGEAGAPSMTGVVTTPAVAAPTLAVSPLLATSHPAHRRIRCPCGIPMLVGRQAVACTVKRNQ